MKNNVVNVPVNLQAKVTLSAQMLVSYIKEIRENGDKVSISMIKQDDKIILVAPFSEKLLDDLLKTLRRETDITHAF